MRTNFLVIISVFLGLAVTSCLDESDNETKARYLEMGSTEVGINAEPLVTTDSDLTLQLKNYPADFEENKRVMITYSIDVEGDDNDLYDYLVDVYSFQDVVTKEVMVLNEESRDTVGTDQIVLNGIWISGGYLNIDFFFYGNKKVHHINVVKDPEEQVDDSTKLFLEVRHDGRGDEMVERFQGIMSFYLEPLQVEGEEMVTLIFENKGFYSAPFSAVEIEYEY